MTKRDRVSWLVLSAIDYALFLVTFIGSGLLVGAHVTAFVLASAPSFPFVTRNSLAGANHLGSLRLNVQLLRIFVIALSSRVVALSLFLGPLGWTPVLAILPAIFISHCVLRNLAAFAGLPCRLIPD